MIFPRQAFCHGFIPMIVSNCASTLVIPAGKKAVFHKMDSQFETRIRITFGFICVFCCGVNCKNGEHRYAHSWALSAASGLAPCLSTGLS
jgi:hypothetical protein